MTSTIQAVPGSFRDPSGRVFLFDQRVLRTVTPAFTPKYEFVKATGLFEDLEAGGFLLPAQRVSQQEIADMGFQEDYVLEVPKLPFVAFPYEWPFSALKDAALQHLQVHLMALRKGVTLSDASAFNVQFHGPRPVFIDHLSFRPYVEGEVWIGHRQFCEQFLNPLLLRVLWGIPHNGWYRGTQEGIPNSELCRLLTWRHYCRWNILTHVVLQNVFQQSVQNHPHTLDKEALPSRPLPRRSFQGLLEKLQDWISSFEPVNTGKTVWADYVRTHSYSTEETNHKKQFVREFVARTQPKLVWDLGCNTGEFSKVALEGGAEYVLGFDADQGALEKGYFRAKAEGLSLQVLYLDAANPSPNQGWMQQERQGLKERTSADGILVLAFIHHLAIARNIPLDQLVNWLIDLAPAGVIEFVPKADPMVKRLLCHREDIFPNYTEDEFVSCISQRAEIIRTKVVSQSRRLLIEYSRLSHS